MKRIVAHLRTFIHLCILTAAFLAAVLASQPWDKNPGEWKQPEIARLLSNSPWAHETSATIIDPYDAIEQTNAPLPGAREAGIAGPSTQPHWDGGPGHNRMGRMPTVPITVRWESALPIREALKLSASADASPVESSVAAKPLAPADLDYIVTVIGLIQGGKYRAMGKTADTSVSSSDGESRKNPDAADPEEVLEAFMQFSRLRTSGMSEIRPQNVKLDPATGAVHIFFPRTRPLSLRQKDVVFVTHFGSLNVQAKFHLSAMKYRGQLEL